MKRGSKSLVLIALLPIVLSACASASPPARFYLLDSDPAAAAGSIQLGDAWVGIGPITTPKYLDRPQMVTRGEGNRLVIHEFDRWAQPVQGRVLDVLIENIVALSDSNRVAPFPWPAAFRPDRRVMGEIVAFEAGPSGEVVLKVRWLLQAMSDDGDRGSSVIVREYRESAPPGDFGAMAAAMSRALSRWSLDIGQALAASD